VENEGFLLVTQIVATVIVKAIWDVVNVPVIVNMVLI
jgi:hypothetical protein